MNSKIGAAVVGVALLINSPAIGQSKSAPQAKYVPVVLSPEDANQVQSDLRRWLKDPEAAKFGEMSAGSKKVGSIIVCGTVNGKNSYGAFTGRQPFIGMLFQNEGKSKFLPIDIASNEFSSKVVIRHCAESSARIKW